MSTTEDGTTQTPPAPTLQINQLTQDRVNKRVLVSAVDPQTGANATIIGPLLSQRGDNDITSAKAAIDKWSKDMI